MIFINSQLTLWHFKYLLSIYPAAELPFTPLTEIDLQLALLPCATLLQCDICDIEAIAHTLTHSQGDMPGGAVLWVVREWVAWLVRYTYS